jgi:hypothetical protein
MEGMQNHIAHLWSLEVSHGKLDYELESNILGSTGIGGAERGGGGAG